MEHPGLSHTWRRIGSLGSPCHLPLSSLFLSSFSKLTTTLISKPLNLSYLSPLLPPTSYTIKSPPLIPHLVFRLIAASASNPLSSKEPFFIRQISIRNTHSHKHLLPSHARHVTRPTKASSSISPGRSPCDRDDPETSCSIPQIVQEHTL